LGTRPGARSLSRTLSGTLTNSGTIASSRTSMQEDSIEDLRFVDVLLEVTYSLVDSIDPQLQSKAVLNQMVKLFGAERGVIFIQDEKSKELSIVAGKKATGEDFSELTGFSGTVVKKVFSSGEPMIVTGTEEGEAIGSESAVLHNLRSIMATPLKIKDEILGVVYIDSSLTKGLFTKDDIDMFSTLSKHVSVGFELSRMAKIELEKANLKRELEVQAAIAVESNKVKVMVDNMQQALFSIDSSGKIVEPVSKFSNQVFGFNVSGTNFLDTLYSADSVQEEQRSGLKSLINTVFGEDELQWSLMETDIPRKISRHLGGESGDKTLKIAPAPIWDESEKLDKILFVVEDVTEIEALAESVKSQRYEASILEQILGKDPDDLSEFLDHSKKICQNLVGQMGSDLSSESLLGMLRDLHTLKGNSRLFGLKILSEKVHDIETAVIEAKDSDSLLAALPKIKDEMFALEKMMNDFVLMSEKVFRHSSQVSKSGGANNFALSQLTESLNRIIPKLAPGLADEIKSSLSRLSYKSVSEMAQKFDGMVQDVSGQLNKKVRLAVKGEALLDSERLKTIQECLLHLIRNSIDHGLEAPEVRTQAHKDPMGTITVSVEEQSQEIIIRLSDDGRGIDGDFVWKQAIKKGIVPAEKVSTATLEEKLNVIFAPGFSSKESVSDISGRGIGLDVVLQNIESLGGQVKIETKVGSSTTFLIKLPKLPTEGGQKLAQAI